MKAGPSGVVLALVVTLAGPALLDSPATRHEFSPMSALAAPPPRPLSNAPWTANVKVNDAGAVIYGVPCIAVDASGNAYAVWPDYRDGSTQRNDIYFSYRPAGGNWSPDTRVDDYVGPRDQYDPSIAVDDGGNAYAVWTDQRDEEYGGDIYFSYRPAGGSWGTSVRVDDDVGTTPQREPSIAVDSGGNAYAVWQDGRAGGGDAYFAYRPAGGSWGTNVMVNDTLGPYGTTSLSIAVDPSGNAYALWFDGAVDAGDIYFSYRPAGGAWGPSDRINDYAGAAKPDFPCSIAVDSMGNAYAVWTDWRNHEYYCDVYFSYRPAGGTWTTSVRVNDDVGTTTGQGLPSIAVDSIGNAYAVWHDTRNGHPDVYFSYRPAGGAWGTNVRVNDDAGLTYQGNPSIGLDSPGNAYAVWKDERNGNSDIYFSYRPAGGLNPVALSYVGQSFLPAGEVMVDEADGRITMGDHVHLRLPFKNTGSQTLSNATVVVIGGQYTGSSAGVSIHNGSNWSNQQSVQLTPATIGPGGTGVADFWIYVTDNDPMDRQSLSGQTWLQVRAGTGQWTIRIALSPISFGISGNEALKSGSCLHHPDSFEIQEYAQYAAGAWTMAATPTNGGDPDTPEQAISNLTNRVNTEFGYRDIWDTRVPDTTLLGRRHADIGVCRDYADLTTGLLRSLGFPSRYTDAVFRRHLPFRLDETVGHAWVEAYLGDGGWRQVDSTWNRALEKSVYENSGFRVQEVWADGHSLSSAACWVGRQYQCIEPCYTAPVDCTACLRESNALRLAWPSPDLTCVEDVSADYRNGGLGEVRLQGDGQLGVQIEAPTFVTLTLPFSVEAGLRNHTYTSLDSITATVSISDTADSMTPLFNVFPGHQVATDVGAGETVTVTWTITPLVAGAGIPLRVAAVSGDLFDFGEKPLVVNEPGTLPDLTLDGICGLDTALPGGDVALTAYVLDENLQSMSDIGTVVTATVYATPTVQFTTTVNLSYSETSGMYEEVVNLPGAAPIGSYEVDFVATHSGYDPDAATTFFAVRPPLTMTLDTNVDTLPVQDTLTMTVGVWDRGAVITEASVWAEIITPGGVITAPLTVGSADAYTLSFRPFDLRADLGGQVPAGDWVLEVTVDYQGSGASAERPITVRPTACVPLVLKGY